MDKRNIYSGRKSDSHVMNFKFNTDKKNNFGINNIDNNLPNNNNNNIDVPVKRNMSNKMTNLHGSFNSNIKNNNINQNLNIQTPTKPSTFSKSISEKPNFYSTKNLGIYNFGDIRLDPNNSNNQHNINNINNFGYVQNNNMNFNMINNGVNYGNNILFYKP